MDIDFESLIRLQRLDTEIRQATLLLENIPGLIEDIEKKIKAGSQAVQAAKEKLSQNQKKRRDLEGSVKDIKVHVAKFKRQLSEVKTNKEYTALLKEIEESQRQVDTVEEEIISEMLAADDIEEEIKVAALKQSEEHESRKKDQDVLSQKKLEMESKREEYIRDREALLPHITAEQMR